MSIERILVGVDGSEHARRALEWAAALAVEVDAEVLVVHAVGLLSAIHGVPEPEVAVHDEVASLVAGEWSAPAREAGASTRTILEAGPPATALQRVAVRERVDLVVVGRRGTGGQAVFGLGSTSLRLSHDTDRPLAIIPA